MSIPFRHTRSALALALLAILAASGCQRSPSGGTSRSTQAAGSGIVAPDAEQPLVATAVPATSATFPPPPPDEAEGRAGAMETWESFAMSSGGQSVRVGYSRTIVSPAAGPSGQEVIRTSNFTRTVMERTGQSIQ